MAPSRACILLLAGAAVAAPLGAADPRLRLGARAVLTAADGTPANDIPGYGLFARYRLNERWAIGVSADRTEYDFEEPARILGLTPSPSLEPIDAVAEATVLIVSLERGHRRAGGRTTWFWSLGVGTASIDVPDVSGPLANGARFDIRTEADDELIAALAVGLRRDLFARSFVEFALRLDQHFADWQVTDRSSGARGAVGDYLAWGGHLGVGFTF
jgi:hypothetical protein